MSVFIGWRMERTIIIYAIGKHHGVWGVKPQLKVLLESFADGIGVAEAVLEGGEKIGF